MVFSKCLNCEKAFEFLPSRSQGKYCTNKCQMIYQWNNVVIPSILEGKNPDRKMIKKFLVQERNWHCEICDHTEWCQQPIPLEVDHIDGDASNNLPENLRLICPNCHAQTPTAKGRNRGKGRKARGLPIN